MYSAALLDYFANPRNTGVVEAADATAQLENPACGDVLELSLRLEGDRIADIRFRAKGCVPTMACASAITELAKGKSIAEARKIGADDLLAKVDGLPAASGHAGSLAVDVLKALLQKV